MGALTGMLGGAASRAGAQLHTRAEVSRIRTDGAEAEVECIGDERFTARHVLAGVAPAVLSRLLGEPAPGPAPEGSQLKVNMLLRRLPRLQDSHTPPELAFAGTFHVNEGYQQLERAHAQAQAGTVPELPPCEVYCHSLTDPSILGPDLRAAGAHTLTLFGLHMPARLFTDDPAGAKARALAATLRSLNSVLAEPIEDCLWHDAGAPAWRRSPRRSSSSSWPCPEGTSSTGTWPGHSPRPSRRSGAGASRPRTPTSGCAGRGPAGAVASAASPATTRRERCWPRGEPAAH
jgi:hypothetical protein